jgi:ATP-GRASP peptide maturase of grasp-with-spasm system
LILLISNTIDTTAVDLSCWLDRYNKPHRWLTNADDLDIIAVSDKQCIFRNHTRAYTLDLNHVTTSFYRQGALPNIKNVAEPFNSNVLSNYSKIENNIISDFLHLKLKTVNHFGHPKKADLNKLFVLEEAKKVNMNVPNYLYTGSKKILEEFILKEEEIICKTIQPSTTFNLRNKHFGSLTKVVTPSTVAKLAPEFYPTFFQKKIVKKLDIRVFFFKDEFYSIAIVSQNNSQTECDFRDYDYDHPNRRVPFNIPQELKDQLKLLTKKLSLQYCSIDFVYGTDKKFYFLEINPIGQFGFLSYAGNYDLIKKIAQAL